MSSSEEEQDSPDDFQRARAERIARNKAAVQRLGVRLRLHPHLRSPAAS